MQVLRIQMSLRLVVNFKAKLGQQPRGKEDEISDDAKAILANLRASHAKLTDGVKTFPRQATFEGDAIISSYTELCLVDQLVGLESGEEQHFKRLGYIVSELPIWKEFLKDVKGVGPAMAGVIISEIDIHKARNPSSLWAYAGLDVASDGGGRSRRKEHLREVEYTDKKGKPAKRVGITFNPVLKTKLTGVLGAAFLRAGDRAYSEFYYNYKHRMESHAVYGVQNDKRKDEDAVKTSKLRRHNMAIRYMIKMFLIDLYVAWRTLEKLPVSKPYSEAKLNIVHGGEAVAV